MTITARIIDAEENTTTHMVESGDTLAVAADQRVALPEIAGLDATLTIDESDVLAVSADGQTLFLPGLVAHLENETGSDLTFADGLVVDSLGTLLSRTSLSNGARDAETGDASLGMADLVHDDADSGVLLYLNDLPAMPAFVAPGEVLELGELVEMGGERDGLLDAIGDHPDQADIPAGPSELWANTELGGSVSATASQPYDDAIVDFLLGGTDGLS